MCNTRDMSISCAIVHAFVPSSRSKSSPSAELRIFAPKKHREEMKKLSKYGAKMNAQDKLALLEQAADECGASVFARRSGRRR